MCPKIQQVGDRDLCMLALTLGSPAPRSSPACMAAGRMSIQRSKWHWGGALPVQGTHAPPALRETLQAVTGCVRAHRGELALPRHRVARPCRVGGPCALIHVDPFQRVACAIVEEQSLLGAVKLERLLLEACLCKHKQSVKRSRMPRKQQADCLWQWHADESNYSTYRSGPCLAGTCTNDIDTRRRCAKDGANVER